MLSKILIPACPVLRATLAFRNLKHTQSIVASAWQAKGRQLHCVTPSLNTLSQRNHLFHHQYSCNSPIDTDSMFNTSLCCGHQRVHCAIVCSRGFSTSSSKFAKELSEKGDVVYRGAISGMIKGVKLFSISTSVIGICLQPFFLFSNQELPVGLKFAIGGIVNFFIFLNPFIIHYIAKKYVTELRWNKATGIFTAVTWSFLIQRRELRFTAEDVKVPDVPGMFTFLEAKGTPLFLEPQAFVDQEAYIHLMGFNKPLDWELPKEKDESGKKSPDK